MIGKLECGIVKFFDTRSDKRFGFIELRSGREVWFHLTAGATIGVHDEDIVFQTHMRPREPIAGDALIFYQSTNTKGAKAAPWGFADEYDRAVQFLAARPTYRLMRQQGGFRFTGNTEIKWEGHDVTKLTASAINAPQPTRLGKQFNGSEWTKWWFEVRTPGGWQEMESDPRTLPPPASRDLKVRPVKKVTMMIVICGCSACMILPIRQNRKPTNRHIVSASSLSFHLLTD